MLIIFPFVHSAVKTNSTYLLLKINHFYLSAVNLDPSIALWEASANPSKISAVNLVPLKCQSYCLNCGILAVLLGSDEAIYC